MKRSSPEVTSTFLTLWKTEVGIMKKLDHPNIVKLYEYDENGVKAKRSGETEDVLYLVLALIKGGELFDDIVNRGKFTEKDAAVLLRQIIATVNYMHTHNIVHRDIKPENILLELNKDYMMCKMIDFGTAKIQAPGEVLKERIGTPYYIAPEILSQNYDNKCDLWSIGVIAFVLLAGVKPFNGSTDQEVFKAIKQGRPVYDDINWYGVSEEAKEFTQRLLQVDPSKRYSAKEVSTRGFHKHLGIGRPLAGEELSMRSKQSSGQIRPHQFEKIQEWKHLQKSQFLLYSQRAINF